MFKVTLIDLKYDKIDMKYGLNHDVYPFYYVFCFISLYLPHDYYVYKILESFSNKFVLDTFKNIVTRILSVQIETLEYY